MTNKLFRNAVGIALLASMLFLSGCHLIGAHGSLHFGHGHHGGYHSHPHRGYTPHRARVHHTHGRHYRH